MKEIASRYTIRIISSYKAIFYELHRIETNELKEIVLKHKKKSL